jgi:uncharacterized flavoprotein (TIGR03862 family)
MAAEVLAAAGARVTIFDRMPSLARKLLLAGRGGLNLTHTEDMAPFLARYAGAEPRLRPFIDAFPPSVVVAWCEALGQPTFVGSSGRVFPTAMKASPLVRAWLQRLRASGVTLMPRHLWTGWGADGSLTFESPAGRVAVAADAAVLALGGASWPRLGSDGGGSGTLAQSGIGIAPLRPANCGFRAHWTDHFRNRFAGAPLKRIALAFDGHVVRGEAVITAGGLEGGAVYALSPRLREAIVAQGAVTLHIDLRPDLTVEDLARRLSVPRGKQSLSTFLRKAAQLSPAAVGLLRETAVTQGEPPGSTSPQALAAHIKAVPVRLTGTGPIERAISTAGGVVWGEVDAHLMLRKRPGTFVCGEMLDWEAPTGGYLLQAALATGAAAGRGALRWCEQARGPATGESAAQERLKPHPRSDNAGPRRA